MILVTGGTGLVGSQLLFDLAKGGDTVRALKRNSGNMDLVNRMFRGREDLLQQIQWVEGDVTDLFSLVDAMKGVKQVYHCAALVSFLHADFKRMLKINTEGTANMVNIAMEAKVDRFCYVSSTAALGRSEENKILTEQSTWKTSKNNSGYAITKYGAEREVWRAIEEGLGAFIVNPSIIIGPGNLRWGSTALFGEVWKGLKFYPTGSSGFVDVRDVTKCMIQLMKKNMHAERFIISAENIPYRDVINFIADGFGKSRPAIRVGNLLSEIGWRFESARKMFGKTKPMITKETARNGQHNWKYSNEKIKMELAAEFIPVQDAVRHACEIFLKEAQHKILL
jgi:dihydroflavonol-4-reductase